MKPLIFDYKTMRVESDYPIIYHYDNSKSLNVVQIEEDEIPFIDLSEKNVEFFTKTRVNRANDDDNLSELPIEGVDRKPRINISLDALLDLSTKTLVSRESDDEKKDLLIEMMTKTKIQRESDDEHFTYN